jgi:site-specific recombinase XerD
LREWLLKEQKISTSSVARVFASIKAMTNFAINELGLEIKNAFAGVYIPPSDAQKRHAISIEDIRRYKLSATNRMMNYVTSWLYL